MEADGFRVYFTPLAGVLFTVPSRYCALSVAARTLALGRWSAQLHTGLLVSGGTQDQPLRRACAVAYPAVTVCGARVPDVFGRQIGSAVRRRQSPRAGLTTPTPQRLPAWHGMGLGSSRFARHYYGKVLSVPRGTEMFQFPRCPPLIECTGHPSSRRWGCPIRRSWDQCLLAAPPRLSQLCHVLHRQ